MVFSSTEFLFLFLPALLLFYYIPVFRKRKEKQRVWWNTVLLLFSIAFYAWGEPMFVFLMLLSVLLNWFLAIRMDRSERHRKFWLTAAVLADTLLLFLFKYVGFLSRNLAALTGNDRLILSIALPIGISFFTSQMMSYVFDVYYGRAAVQRNPFYVALYITLFPQLIAGPIVRYQQVADEITERSETAADLAEGTRRFVYGLGKKVLLANFLAQIADNAFTLSSPSVLVAWMGALAYTLQIYFDFSGYSDMAIGLGRMFGFHFLENFDYPYMARSVTEFWRRWHISLSSWFRDYVYIPLGGNRVGRARWIRNLLIVWLLTGIWHGANWTFVLWGLLYFGFLLIEKLTGFADKIGPLRRLYTLLVVIAAWVFFRADTVGAGAAYLGRMIGIGAGGFADGAMTWIRGTYVIWILGLIGCTPLLSGLFRKLRAKRLDWIENAWLLLVFGASVLEIIGSSYNPFIYFNF